MEQWRCALEISNAAAGSWTSWRRDTRQKPWARQAGEEQCLGEMPWKKPGDCDQARRIFVQEVARGVNAAAGPQGAPAAACRPITQPAMSSSVGRVGLERI